MRLLPRKLTKTLAKPFDWSAKKLGVNKVDLLPPGVAQMVHGVDSMQRNGWSGKNFAKGFAKSAGNQLKLGAMGLGAYYAAPVVAQGGAKLGGLFSGGAAGGFDLAGIDAAQAAVSESVKAGGYGSGASSAASAGGTMGKLGKLGGFFKKHGGTLIDAGALAENVYQNRRQNKIADRYRALAEAEYAKRAPMRDKAMALMLDDTTPDTSAMFADPYAPNGRFRRVRVGSDV